MKVLFVCTHVFHAWAKGKDFGVGTGLDSLSLVMKFYPVCRVFRHLGKVIRK